MEKALLKMVYLLILVVALHGVQMVVARVPEGCSTAADCDRLCGGTGDCAYGICKCLAMLGSQKESNVEELRDLSCSNDRDCQVRCAPVCYSKLCVDGRCQCVCID